MTRPIVSRIEKTAEREARCGARLAGARATATLLALLLAGLAVSCRSAREADRPVDVYSRPLAPGQLALEQIDVSEHPDFSVGFGDRDSLVQAIDESLAYYAKPSSKRYFPYAGITHAHAVESLRALRELATSGRSPRQIADEIERRFEVWRSVGCDGRGTVLFTGYCEPIFDGSPVRTARFRVPLYRLPEDLVKDDEGRCLGRRTESGALVPYATRGEIDGRGFLAGRDLELVWLESPLDAYIVHVQGSARIRMPDGRERRVGYAGKTDRPYRSLGEKLIEDGALQRDDLSLMSIREYFDRHPDELEEALWHNESYVFFTETHDGPYGSLNAKVTPMRTIATDKSVFPRGAMAFLDTRLPAWGSRGRLRAEPYAGFALDQDTGGAIRSAGRCDVFIGTGPDAERIAGATKFEGRLYYLFLRPEEAALAVARREDRPSTGSSASASAAGRPLAP